MPVVGRLDQYASMLTTEFDETTANGPSITGLGTYYVSEFNENIVDIVTSGLVLNLDAGASASYSGIGTVWNDISGSGNDGILENQPTYSTANRGSIVFDGINDYVTSSFSTTLGQAVTYSGWLYSTETTSTYRNFVDSVTANPMIWWNTSGQIEFDAALYTTTAVYRNQWVHVALSKPSGSSSASYYVNGVLVGTGSAYTTPALTPTWFNRAGTQTWKGNSSNVQTYNIALSADEIAQNYNILATRFDLSPINMISQMSANVFAPYDLVYDEFGGTLFGPGQGRYMRQNTDKTVIVYNEIDEITTII